MDTLFTPYGLLAALALLATLLVAGLWCRLRKVPYGAWIRLCAAGIPLAWVCSRVTFCLATLPTYIAQGPELMLHFWEGGGSMFGAFGGLLLAAWLTARRQGVKPAVLLDAVGLGAPLGVIIERIAESTVEGMGWGEAVMSDWLLPISVESYGSYWHAVYRYEAIATGVILLALIGWLIARKGHIVEGDLLLVFMTLYGCAQVVLESLRDDGHMVVHHFVHISQIVAILLPAAALLVWTLRLAKKGTKKSHVIVPWLITAACIGVGIAQEFAVDHSENLYIDYSIMAAAMVIVAVTALVIRRRANR